VGKGQLINSIGLVWREIFVSLHKGLPPQVRAFFYFTLIATHVLVIHCICCKYVFVLFIFFSSAGQKSGLKKSYDAGAKQAFVLEPITLVANTFV
jgi:hypothetical protein